MSKLTDLIEGNESIALVLRYGDVTVEVTGESVIFRDPEKGDEEITSFDHDNFADIVRAFELVTRDE